MYGSFQRLATVALFAALLTPMARSQVAPVQGPIKSGTFSGVKGPVGHIDPDKQAREERYQELQRQFREADDQHDLRAAERIVLQMIALKPETHWDYWTLAQIYDKLHFDRDAYEAWREVLEWRFNGAWSAQTDVRYLTHYGDLALKLGEPTTAVRAYRAASAAKRMQDIPVAPLGEDETMNQVRARAHSAEAVCRFYHGDDKGALDDLRLCISLLPNSPETHLAYARMLLLDNRGGGERALPEYRIAYYLTDDPAARKAIHDEVTIEKHIFEEYSENFITLPSGKVVRTKTLVKSWP